MRILILLTLLTSCFVEDVANEGVEQRSNTPKVDGTMEKLSNLISNNNIEETKEFLKLNPNIINKTIPQRNNIYPIYLVVMPEMLEVLIDNGADINKVYALGSLKRPYLIHLMENHNFGDQNLSMIKILLENGANVNELITSGKTVFSEFIQKFHKSNIVKKAYILENDQEVYLNIMKKMIGSYNFENETIDNYEESAIYYTLRGSNFFNELNREDRIDEVLDFLRLDENSLTDEMRKKVNKINSKRKQDFTEVILGIVKKTKEDIINKVFDYKKS